MKKFAIGCAIVLVVLLVVAGGIGYWAYSKFVRPVAQFAASMQALEGINKQVKNTSSFTAPDNGELTQEMVNRFVKVQESMATKLGARMTDLKAKYDRLDQMMKSENRQASVSEGLGAFMDLGTLLVDAKKTQVEALNQAGFSLQEYAWVRKQVYAAVGMAVTTFDLQEFAQSAGAKVKKGEESESIGDVPEKNKELVAPHAEKLKEWAPFSFFGL